MKKRNRFQLKLFLTLIMVLDHVGYFIPPNWTIAFHILTRMVGVGFAYFTVEGFLYTRNVKRYLSRLYLAAALMAAGNFLLNTLSQNPMIQIHNNIFLTLALGISAIYAWHSLPKIIFKIISVLALTIVSVFLAEGGIVIIPFMLLTYWFRGHVTRRNVAYLLFSLLLVVMTISDAMRSEFLTRLMLNPDFLFITVIPFLGMYNGKPGPKTAFSKYFFYLFYPAHLWLITLVALIQASS